MYQPLVLRYYYFGKWLVWIQPCWVEFTRNIEVCNKSDQSLTSIGFDLISRHFHFRQPLIFNRFQQPFCGRNLASIPEKIDSNRVSRFPSILWGFCITRGWRKYNKIFGACKDTRDHPPRLRILASEKGKYFPWCTCFRDARTFSPCPSRTTLCPHASVKLGEATNLSQFLKGSYRIQYEKNIHLPLPRL